MRHTGLPGIGLWLTAPLLCLAQSGSVEGPVLGFVLDAPTSSMRPLLGIPGAATTGGSLPLGFDFTAAEVSPRQDYVLAVASGGEIRLVRLRGEIRATPVANASPGADRLVLSPSGSAAALYHSGGPLEILTGLPDSPKLAANLDLAALPGAPGLLAVADDGVAVAAVQLADGQALFLLGAGRDPQPLPAYIAVSLAVFGGSTHDLYLAGRERNALAVIRDVTGDPAFQVLAGSSDGIAGPVGLAITPDNRRAFVANADNGTVVVWGAGPTISVPCQCEVTGLQALNGAALFRLTDISASPVWLLDGGGPDVRLWFRAAGRGR